MAAKMKEQAAALGLTYGEYLRQLAECGDTILEISLRVGVNSSRIYYEWHRYGMKKRRSKDFEFLGVVDSLNGHCEALDLNVNIVRLKVFHKQMSPADALREMLAEQQADELREMGAA